MFELSDHRNTSGKDFRCNRELGGSTPDGGQLEEKLQENFLSFRRPSEELSGRGSHSFGEDQPKAAEMSA